MSDAADDDGDLPPDLAETAAERLLAVAGDERERVLAELLAAHPRHAAALRRLGEQLAGAEAMLDATFTAVRGEAPASVGGHRVLRTLGEGAFGVVYLCRQERPVVRDVAIKVLRPGAGDQQTLRRFAVERQLLATLSHPTITQVFDAGELADGRPFFVMEFVDGVTIRAWCERHALACDARLRLFVQVCRGVAHAHSRGIVHRDLKPANVLVTDGGDGPAPKIIDFGIAKALHATHGGDVQQTATGRVIGTPGYMSPEQAAGRAGDVDARADVFALGVMLYELLTGALPWESGSAATDTDPPRPSQRVTTVRGATPTALRQMAAQLRGDLDWIVLKALARDREERYPSVAALIADLERHLAGEAVSVGPPSLRYRLRKFVRRRRAAVTALAVVVALAGGLLVALRHASNKDSEAAIARDDARARMSAARSIVARLLQRADAPELYDTAEGDAVRKALSAEALHFAEQLAAGDPDDSQLQADRCEALQSVAQVHWLLGEPTLAREAAASATAIARRLSTSDPADRFRRGMLGRSLRQEGRAVALAGEPTQARAIFAEAIEHLAACAAQDLAAHGIVYAATLRELTACTAPGSDERIDTARRALAAYLAVAEDERGEVREGRLASRMDLAEALFEARRFEAAKGELDQAATAIDSLPDRKGRMAVEFYGLRANIAWAMGGREDTVADFEAAAAAAARWCAAQPRRIMAHRMLLSQRRQLGRVQGWLGDFEASTASYRQAIAAAEAMTQQFPDDVTGSAYLITNLYDFAFMLRERFVRKGLDEAALAIARALAMDAKIAPEAEVRNVHPQWQMLALQAGIAESLGDADADARWRAVEPMLPTADASWGDDMVEMFLEAATAIARCHHRAGELDAATRVLDRARALFDARPDQKKRVVEVAWLEAQIAAARADHTAIDAAATRILAARPTWFGRRRAADCMHLAWRTAQTHGDVDAGTVASYRDRATEWYEMVIATLQEDIDKTPDDPWFVLPWGFSLVRLAELEHAAGNAVRARVLLAKALPRLDAVRANVQMDQWDAAAFADGLALRERLAD